MNLFRNLHFLTIALLGASLASAQVSEKDRLSGFAEHHNKNDRFDAARMQGERAYYEYEEQWENKKRRDLEQYKATKKQVLMSEDGPEAKADEAAKKRYAETYELAQKDYEQARRKKENMDRQALQLPSEEQELGLDITRPRYDYRKRAFYTGRSPIKGAPSSSSSGGSSSGGSSFGGGSSGFGGGSSFPPPPSFDDFNDGGYIPAPNISDDFGDVPPPPPPPPPPFGDDGGDFMAPPPPPFGGDGGDF